MTTEYIVDTPTETRTYVTLSNLLTEGYPADTVVVFYDQLVGYEGTTTIKTLEEKQARANQTEPPQVYQRGADYWYRFTNPITGESRRQGPFDTWAQAQDSIDADAEQTMHAMSPLNSDLIRGLRDTVARNRATAARATELASKAEAELAQAIAAAMIKADQ